MNIAIIGAGFAGLSAAIDLQRAGHTITILEAKGNPGGLASGFKAPHWDWSLERFYHHIFESDDHILSLAQEIGVRDKFFFPTPRTSMFMNGKIYPATPLWRQLFLPMSPLSTMRWGFTGLYLLLSKNWQQLEQVTAHQWLTKAIGQAGYQVLWEPMLMGKFGEYYKDVNMAWMWARLHSRTVNLGYYQGGFQAFAHALANHLSEQGVNLLYNTPVQRIEKAQGDGVLVHTEDGPQHFDQVLVTLSPHLLGKLTPELPPDYLAALDKLKSMGAVVMIFSLKQSVTTEDYWINLPKKENMPFLAFVEHTNYIDPQHYGGDHIVYCGDYLKPGHAYFSMSKEQLLDIFIPAIKRFNPDFDATWINQTWLFKEAYAQPVPPVNHSRNIPPLQTPIDGLFWASMSQVYPWDRGTNYAVQIGRSAAAEMMQQKTGV